MSDVGKCAWCGAEIEWECDVCDEHAMSHEQLAEMARRTQRTIYDYRVELWGEPTR